MSAARIENASRRRFLKAGSGLALAIYLPLSATAKMKKERSFAPNAFVRIGEDDMVTVIVKHLEMGQGTYTGLPTLVAEELDADWGQIRVEGAPANTALHGNLLLGNLQGTFGSTSLANSFEQFRRAGATARAMLVAAAAERWQVSPASIGVVGGVVSHAPSGRTARFGELAAAAAELPLPDKVDLKNPADFVLIGKGVKRKDSRAKIDGSAQFTQDVRLPGMLLALVAHPPWFGARVKRFDAEQARAVRGVIDVVAIPSGVAVLATNFWAAKKGRDRLKVEWDASGAFGQCTHDIVDEFRGLLEQPGRIARNVGECAPALDAATHRLVADFEFPYLAHAAMEPLNCVVRLDADSCEIWNGEQFQTADQAAVAAVTGFAPERVKLNMLYAGGSFGRRASSKADYLVEAVHIAKAIGGRAPVKLMWTREDDMRGGYYRPMYVHRLEAGLDRDGALVAWQHRIVGQSIATGTVAEPLMVHDGVDRLSVEGATDLPYAVPNLRVELHSPQLGVPVLWFRSVGSLHTAFAIETFIDELAAKAGQDAVAFRRKLLAQQPRHLGVLELAAAKSGWGQPLDTGEDGERRGRGIAVHQCFGSVVAQVAEVTVRADRSFKVDRVVCAIDCGLAVNPDIIRAQMEGGIGFGLSAALHGQITLREGIVEQFNFTEYPILRMNEMPRVEVHIVASAASPSGVGEPATPVIGPALANALFAASGERLRQLPLRLDQALSAWGWHANAATSLHEGCTKENRPCSPSIA